MGTINFPVRKPRRITNHPCGSSYEIWASINVGMGALNWIWNPHYPSAWKDWRNTELQPDATNNKILHWWIWRKSAVKKVLIYLNLFTSPFEHTPIRKDARIQWWICQTSQLSEEAQQRDQGTMLQKYMVVWGMPLQLFISWAGATWSGHNVICIMEIVVVNPVHDIRSVDGQADCTARCHQQQPLPLLVGIIHTNNITDIIEIVWPANWTSHRNKRIWGSSTTTVHILRLKRKNYE